MLIDWFTVIAQVINFLVLAWLLKRFLYHPILNAIDEREQRIANELADADQKRAEAEQQRETFEQKNAAFEKHRAASMNKVSVDAKVESARLLDLVRQESDALRSQLTLAVKNEYAGLQESLNQSVKSEVFAIARKALSDLSESSLEESIVRVFVKRLNALSDEEKNQLHVAFQHSNDALIVRTAFDLTDAQRLLIKTAINAVLNTSVDVQFLIDVEVISGIEINTHGQKIAWSLGDYLASLNKRIDHIVHSKSVLDSNDKEQGL